MVASLNTAPNASAAKGDTGATGHWYTLEGSTVHPLYKEGGVFSLREARKLAKEGRVVLPSVTTYFRVLHKQALQDWLMEQSVKAALTLDRRGFATDDAFIDAAVSIANNSSKDAMSLGTKIHKAIEIGLDGGDFEAEMAVYVNPVFAKLKEIGFKAIAQEKCLASPKYGYAGRCDLLGKHSVMDFKSRKTTPGRKVRSYGTDLTQLLAYGVAEEGDDFINQGACYNMVISTTEPGRVEVIAHAPEDHHNAFQAFLGLTAIWRYESGFDPRVKEAA